MNQSEPFNYQGQKSVGGGKMRTKLTRVHEPLTQTLKTNNQYQDMQMRPTRVKEETSVPPPLTFTKAWAATDYNPNGTPLSNGTNAEEDDGFWKKLFLTIQREKETKEEQMEPPKIST